jgi:hypothetical protein
MSAVVDAVTEQGGEVVASVDAGKHWVLIYKANRGSFLVDDPDPTCRRRAISKKGHRIPVGDGIVLLPKLSKLAIAARS